MTEGRYSGARQQNSRKRHADAKRKPEIRAWHPFCPREGRMNLLNRSAVFREAWNLGGVEHVLGSGRIEPCINTSDTSWQVYRDFEYER